MVQIEQVIRYTSNVALHTSTASTSNGNCIFRSSHSIPVHGVISRIRYFCARGQRKDATNEFNSFVWILWQNCVLRNQSAINQNELCHIRGRKNPFSMAISLSCFNKFVTHKPSLYDVEKWFKSSEWLCFISRCKFSMWRKLIAAEHQSGHWDILSFNHWNFFRASREWEKIWMELQPKCDSIYTNGRRSNTLINCTSISLFASFHSDGRHCFRGLRACDTYIRYVKFEMAKKWRRKIIVIIRFRCRLQTHAHAHTYPLPVPHLLSKCSLCIVCAVYINFT